MRFGRRGSEASRERSRTFHSTRAKLPNLQAHEFSLFSRARLPKDGGDEPCVDRRDRGGRPRYHLPRAQVVQSARVPSRPRPRQRHPAGRLPAPSQSGLPGRPRDVSRVGARPRRQDVSRPETAGMPGVGRSGGWGTAEGQPGARVHRCEHPRRARPSPAIGTINLSIQKRPNPTLN